MKLLVAALCLFLGGCFVSGGYEVYAPVPSLVYTGPPVVYWDGHYLHPCHDIRSYRCKVYKSHPHRWRRP